MSAAYLKQTLPSYIDCYLLSHTDCHRCNCQTHSIDFSESKLPCVLPTHSTWIVSALVSFTLMLQSGRRLSSSSTLIGVDLQSLPCKMFECAHLKFTESGQSKQNNQHTHMHVQCSHTSVRLIQAHPKLSVVCILHIFLCMNTPCTDKK